MSRLVLLSSILLLSALGAWGAIGPVNSIDAGEAPSIGAACPANFPTIYLVRSTGDEYWCNAGVWAKRTPASAGACPVGTACANSFASGGSGTRVDPWTGWEAVFDEPAPLHVHFPSGYYTWTTAKTADLGTDAYRSAVFTITGDGPSAVTIFPHADPVLTIGPTAEGNQSVEGVSVSGIGFELDQNLWYDGGLIRLNRVILSSFRDITLEGGVLPQYPSTTQYSGYLFRLSNSYSLTFDSIDASGRYVYLFELDDATVADEQFDTISFTRTQVTGPAVGFIRFTNGGVGPVRFDTLKIKPVLNSSAEMNSNDQTTLSGTALAGASSLAVASTSGFAVGDPIIIGWHDTMEVSQISSITSNINLATTLRFTHGLGEPVLHGTIGLGLAGNTSNISIEGGFFEQCSAAIYTCHTKHLAIHNSLSTCYDLVRMTSCPVGITPSLWNADISDVTYTHANTTQAINVIHVTSGADSGNIRNIELARNELNSSSDDTLTQVLNDAGTYRGYKSTEALAGMRREVWQIPTGFNQNLWDVKLGANSVLTLSTAGDLDAATISVAGDPVCVDSGSGCGSGGGGVTNGSKVDITVADDVWTVNANAVDLGTDTVGNYAGSSSEGGPALTASAFTSNPGNCIAGLFAQGVSSTGIAECTQVQFTNLGGISGLTWDDSLNILTADGGFDTPAHATEGQSLTLREGTDDAPSGAGTEHEFLLKVPDSGGLSGDFTCTLQSSGRLPDSCVGDGSDGGITAEVNDLETTDPTEILDDEVYVGNGAGSGTFVALLDCDDTAGKLDWNGTAFVCNIDQTGGGGGDSVTIDGAAAVDPDFRSEGDIDTIRCTGAGAPDASCVASDDVIFRYQPTSIVDADVNASAAIAESKLAFATNNGSRHDHVQADITDLPWSACMTIDTPTDAMNWLLMKAPETLTVTGIDCLVGAATSAVITVQECNADGGSCGTTEAAINCAVTNTTEASSIDDATIDSGDWIRIDVGTVTGTVGQVVVCVEGTR